MKRILSTITLCTVLAATAAVSTQAGSFKGRLGLQLYSLRDQFPKDIPGTLSLVNKFGIKYVELAGTYGLTPAEFKKQLRAHHLVAISGHYQYDEFRDHIDRVIKEAKLFGLKYVGCPWIPHQGAFTEQDCRQAAAVFNRAGKELAQHHLKFFYHPHGYEFQPWKNGTLFDLLMQETNPKYVSFEMDILWIYFPGQDPVKLMEKYGKRWQLFHLKDLKKGVATGSLSASTDVNNDVPLGMGEIPIPAILKEAQKIHVKYYFIEDESSRSVTQIPETIDYLKHVRF